MGLDSYLVASKFYWSHKPHQLIDPDLPEGYQPQYLKVKAAYWRKANHIHQWFVDNVQNGDDDCQDYFVSREQLLTLVDTCKQVLTDPAKLAPELLPTQSGFFFGSTDYDEYYVSQLQYTVDRIEEALTAFDERIWDFEYHSSW